jgi:hypothetical protein
VTPPAFLAAHVLASVGLPRRDETLAVTRPALLAAHRRASETTRPAPVTTALLRPPPRIRRGE